MRLKGLRKLRSKFKVRFVFQGSLHTGGLEKVKLKLLDLPPVVGCVPSPIASSPINSSKEDSLMESQDNYAAIFFNIVR